MGKVYSNWPSRGGNAGEVGASARRAIQRLACVGDDDTMMRVPLSRRVMHRLARGSCVWVMMVLNTFN